ncbi:fibronectin type III domain-containing protein [Pedobacter sp. SL55]|uniref:fibronectin type III domain-containing protein n=1 Tax=Pedobacter sp. SL55 TaxID=2995161 RepID=UPI00226D5A45|nr:fibronectin type III domain-containing protein [Pedobacter sp. SL55]WAC41875.1 fibronectin type III domain-containing protein [Pedobacter sp. SL55]
MVDDLEFTPAANAYPYYLSTSNTAPSNNTAATSVATGTSINLSNLQPSTTYYLWMRTYNGDSYGNWTVSPLSFTTAPQVLPIELKSLQAEVKGNNLLVNWQTSSESNNSHFFVQVPANGRTWTDLAKVASKAANGNAATELSYTFSFPLGQIALAGFGLLGLFLLPATRNKWLRLLMVALVIGGMAGCAKTSELSDELNNGLKTGQAIYVRLAQVDLNGTINYSEAVLVKR